MAFLMNETHNQEKNLRRARMADAVNMPKDVVLGVPIVTMLGQIELHIENYGGLLEYTDVLIRIRTKAGQIKVTGEGMQIDFFTNDEMKVSGRIKSIEYPPLS